VVDPGGVLFGDYGDMRGRAWGVWAKTTGAFDGPVNPLLAAPHGIKSASQVVNQPLSEWPVLLIAKLSNEITAINWFTFAAFPLTAFVTFLVLDRLLRNREAAFVGGFAFGFAPAAVLQAAGGHGEYAFNLFIPLFLLALFHNRGHRTLRSAFLLALAFAAITLASLYMGYFSIYLGLYFVAFDYLTAPRVDRRKLMRNYAYCGVFAALILLPFEFRAIHEQLTASRESIAKAGHIRDFSDLVAFSARVWDLPRSVHRSPGIGPPLRGIRAQPVAREQCLRADPVPGGGASRAVDRRSRDRDPPSFSTRVCASSSFSSRAPPDGCSSYPCPR
jgi:hypothetical protein